MRMLVKIGYNCPSSASFGGVLNIAHYIVTAIAATSSMWGAHVVRYAWPAEKTFSQYLSEHNISSQRLFAYSKDDLKFLTEIRSGVDCFELRDDNGTLEQALIPISEQMQIHLFRRAKEGGYRFDIVPIVYKSEAYYASVRIERTIYDDVLAQTGNEILAKRASFALRKVIDTKTIRPGDTLDILYRQKMRLDKIFGVPRITVMRYVHDGKERYVYVDDDGIGHTDVYKKVAYTVTGVKKSVLYVDVARSDAEGRFGMPLRHVRITSRFSYRRWHPILHRYRPHHGIDFGARRGTPILAINEGTVVYAGWMRGYGRTVKIKHKGGYVSLYAHQSRLRVKRGEHVKKGQIIGYVGSTGRSTGPHLHLGVMKNGRWIDPMKVIGKVSLRGKKRKKMIKYEPVKETRYKRVAIPNAAEEKRLLQSYIAREAPVYRWRKEMLDGKLFDIVRLDDAIQD